MKKINIFLWIIFGGLLISPFSRGYAEGSRPWRLRDALGLPDWITFSVNHRTRYETLNNTFRAHTSGDDQILAFRTLVLGEIRFRGFRLGGELEDSRIALDSPGTPVNTTLVNQVELLQAYLAWEGRDVFGSGLDLGVKGGRLTMDFGSRRLIARNRFRNTLNGFDGIDFNLSRAGEWQWRSFFVFPVTRLPGDAEALRRGQTQFDEENGATFFIGTFLGLDRLPLDSRGELYAYYLHEEDTHHHPIATKNRKLWTPGVRWYRKPDTGRFDFEFEAALQTGSSRASKTSTDSLDHFAYFGHAAVGYTFDLPWRPRFLVQYDYASGDEDPNDGDHDRFDTLFGARRFEFGPTSIWGAFARGNLNSPGFRVQVKPAPTVDGFFAYRAFWLAEKRDAWTGAGLRDASGGSGGFLGHQIEIRTRWHVIPALMTLEAGWAHLFKGKFARNAPDAPNQRGDSNYFYSQTIITF
ncbi:MAG: alginate export family protein [Methylothermaceae bacterium]|nr:alginate export family protein [Methylothermaceae bacterium]